MYSKRDICKLILTFFDIITLYKPLAFYCNNGIEFLNVSLRTSLVSRGITISHAASLIYE